MLLNSKSIALLACLALPLNLSFGDDRINELIAEVKALRQQVTDLESRIQALEANEAPASAAVAAETPSGNNFFEKMRIELKKAEVRASGSWTRPESWSKIAKGMEKEEAIAILGEPTRLKFSVRLDTDEILIYEGDLSGDGEPVYGEVRIYKGKIRRFSAPDLPEE